MSLAQSEAPTAYAAGSPLRAHRPHPNPFPADWERAKARRLLRRSHRHFQLHRLAAAECGDGDFVAGADAAEGEVEIVEAGDFSAGEFDDDVAAFEASLFSRAAGGDAGDGVAFRFAGEIGNAAEVGAASLALDAGLFLDLDVRRAGRLLVGVGDDLLDQVDDAIHPLDVDLLPVVGRTVVVGVRAGEEVQHRNFLRVKRRLVAGAETFRLEDQLQLIDLAAPKKTLN
jgi:hypothetical protein